VRHSLVDVLFAGLLVAAGCGGSGGTAPTPTSVVGVWDLRSVDFTNNSHATASGVVSFDLRADSTVSIVNCLAPEYVGTMLACTQRRVCGTGTYTFDGTTLTIHETGQTSTKGGAVTFGPGAMTVSGPDLLGASVSASHFYPIAALSTDCAPI
jgi:hypothetical protein